MVVPAVRSGLCSEADPETPLRGWQRSRDRGVAVTASHPWMAGLSPTGQHGVLRTYAWQRRLQPAGNSMGGFQMETEDSMSPSSQEEGGPCVAATQEAAPPPGVLASMPPETLVPPPQSDAVAKSIALLFCVAEETEPPKGTDNLPSATSQG